MGGSKLTKFMNIVLACLIAVTFVAAPLTASARIKDEPNSGFCKSGKHVGNIKRCKENGGRW